MFAMLMTASRYPRATWYRVIFLVPPNERDVSMSCWSPVVCPLPGRAEGCRSNKNVSAKWSVVVPGRGLDEIDAEN